MAAPTIAAESEPLTKADLRNQEIARELVQSQHKAIVDFAKHLVTVSFTAIGVVLALSEKWLGKPPATADLALLGIAIAFYLVTGVLATLAAGVFAHKVSLDDYAEVESELRRVAGRRYRLTAIGFGCTVAATVLVAFVAIWP